MHACNARPKSLAAVSNQMFDSIIQKLPSAHTSCTEVQRLLQVGNFRVEPPGLFRGRGEHPKMGKLKVCTSSTIEAQLCNVYNT